MRLHRHQSASIDISLLELYDFKITCFFPFGVNVYSLLLFLLTNFLLWFLNINHLMKFYLELFHHIPLFEFSDVYVLLKIWIFNINLMSEPNLVFLLVIRMVKMDIACMISKIIKFMSLVMSYFISQFVYIMISHLHRLKIQSPLLQLMMMELLNTPLHH